MTMAHLQCALLPETTISFEANTNRRHDSKDNGKGEDENGLYLRISKFKNLPRHGNCPNILMHDSESGQEKSFQYPDLDIGTSLPPSDSIERRSLEQANGLKLLQQWEKNLTPSLFISEASSENHSIDRDETPCSRISFQGSSAETLAGLLEAGSKTDNPDSGIESTPVLPNHSHFDFSHVPEPTISTPLSTYLWLLNTQFHTSPPCAPRASGPSYCCCNSWPGVAHLSASHNATTGRPVSLLEPESSKCQSNDESVRQVPSEVASPKYEFKKLIEGRVYDKDDYEHQKQQSHFHHSSSQTEPGKHISHLFSRGALSIPGPVDLIYKGPENFSPLMSSASSLLVNSFHLPSPTLISKSSFDQLTKELLRAKEMKKVLEEDNEKLRQELQAFQTNQVYLEKKINLLEHQVQKDMVQPSQELSQLLSQKETLEKKEKDEEEG